MNHKTADFGVCTIAFVAGKEIVKRADPAPVAPGAGSGCKLVADMLPVLQRTEAHLRGGDASNITAGNAPQEVKHVP